MGSHPINLAIRFLLEVAALLSMGIWGWRFGEGWLRLALAALIPTAAAVLWGTVAVHYAISYDRVMWLINQKRGR